MKPARSFEDLLTWRKAHELVLQVYSITSGFPRDELYTLTSQLRRAVISIPANIAEGFKKQSTADKARYLNIAEGSLEECRYYFILSRDLKYIQDGDYIVLKRLGDEVGKLINRYRSVMIEND